MRDVADARRLPCPDRRLERWTGSEDGWLGGDTTMWWSHADVETYDRRIADTGFAVLRREFVPEDGGGLSLFWARGQTPRDLAP